MTPKTESEPRKRGRPPGRSQQGEAMQRRLYTTAVELIGMHGYESTTLHDIANEADVSVGLLYRYFPNKRAVVLALYDALSTEYAGEAGEMEPGPWRDRFLFALKTSLDVLGTQRATLSELLPILLSNGSEGLFASSTSFSRDRVQAVFQDTVRGATDAPKSQTDIVALGNVLYTLHLTVILWWLMDKSPDQRATAKFVAALEQILPTAAVALKLKPARKWVHFTSSLIQDGLFGRVL